MGKSIIIKKEKGQIAEVEKIKRSNFIPYFTKKDKCFENILSQEDIIKLPSKEKSEIIRKAKSIKVSYRYIIFIRFTYFTLRCMIKMSKGYDIS